MPDAPPSPTDDELVGIMIDAFRNAERDGKYGWMNYVLASIRPLLEARGIEMAAKKAKGYAKMAQEEIDRRKLSSGDAFGWCAAASSLAIILEAYAQRHAEGGK